MMRILPILGLFVLPFLWPVAAQAQCATPQPGPDMERRMDIARPDQGVLTAAILAEVNVLRCQKGLAPLAPSLGLTEVATRHSWYMAAEQVLGHDSKVPGQTTLRERLDASGEAYAHGAENVGYVAGCGRSYAELARAIVRVWRGAPGHRANLLNGRLARAGAGVAFSNGCRRAYVTLAMVG